MNLTEIFNQENKREELRMPFPFEEFQGEKIENSPELKLILTNLEKGKILIAGEASLKFVLSCDRCLKPVEQMVELWFEREIFAPELITDEDTKETYSLNCKELSLNFEMPRSDKLIWIKKR